MSENPYTPPAANVEGPAGGLAGGTGTFSIGQCVSDAWATTWANFPLWLGVGIVGSIAFALSGLTVIGIFLVWPVLSYGAVVFVLRMHDGNADFGDLWAGFNDYGSNLASGLGLWVLITLLGYVGQIPLLIATFAESAVGMVVGQLINLIWVFVIVRFYFAFFVWVEEGAGPIEALGRSWALTSAVKWKVIGLILVMGAIFMVALVPLFVLLIPAAAGESPGLMAVGMLAFVVMMFPATMIGYMLYVSAYRQVAGRPEVVN